MSVFHDDHRPIVERGNGEADRAIIDLERDRLRGEIISIRRGKPHSLDRALDRQSHGEIA